MKKIVFPLSLRLLHRCAGSCRRSQDGNQGSSRRSPPSPWDLAFGSAVMTDYVFRGITQSNHAGSVAAYFVANLTSTTCSFMPVSPVSISFRDCAAAEIDFYGGVRPTFALGRRMLGSVLLLSEGGKCFNVVAVGGDCLLNSGNRGSSCRPITASAATSRRATRASTSGMRRSPSTLNETPAFGGNSSAISSMPCRRQRRISVRYAEIHLPQHRLPERDRSLCVGRTWRANGSAPATTSTAFRQYCDRRRCVTTGIYAGGVPYKVIRPECYAASPGRYLRWICDTGHEPRRVIAPLSRAISPPAVPAMSPLSVNPERAWFRNGAARPSWRNSLPT